MAYNQSNKRYFNKLFKNLGIKNYRQQAELNPADYEEILNNNDLVNKLIKETKDKKANVIKGYDTPIIYESKYANDYATPKEQLSPYDNERKLALTGNLQNPQIRLLKPLSHASKIGMLGSIGHELGHVNNRLHNRKESEAKADKYISKYLKNMGLNKKQRQTVYTNRWATGKSARYNHKFGNLKYLKDYLFGFSNNKNDYYFLAREYLKSIHLL